VKTKNYIALFTALFLFIAGCSIERNLKLDARVPLPPAVKQIPLHIGVYYSPEFIEYTKKIELVGCGPNGRRDKTGIFFIFPVGNASRDLFDQIFTSIFATVTRMSDLSNSFSDNPAVDGFLEPRIKSFDWDTACSQNYLSTGHLSARVNYVIDLHDPDGNLVISMPIEGRSKEKPKVCFGEGCKDSIVAEQAMQDAIAKFMINFGEQPDVKQWLSTRVSAPGKRQ